MPEIPVLAAGGYEQILFAIGDAQETFCVHCTDIAGVDLLYDRQGRCYVIEVNAVPGWQAFAKTTGIDVAARLLAELSI